MTRKIANKTRVCQRGIIFILYSCVCSFFIIALGEKSLKTVALRNYMIQVQAREFNAKTRMELSLRISLLMQSLNECPLESEKRKDPANDIILGYGRSIKRLGCGSDERRSDLVRWDDSPKGRIHYYKNAGFIEIDSIKGRCRLTQSGVNDLTKLLSRARECGLENLGYKGKIDSKLIGDKPKKDKKSSEKVCYASLSCFSFDTVDELIRDYADKMGFSLREK